MRAKSTVKTCLVLLFFLFVCHTYGSAQGSTKPGFSTTMMQKMQPAGSITLRPSVTWEKSHQYSVVSTKRLKWDVLYLPQSSNLGKIGMSCVLDKWEAGTLPFFCRIEHQLDKKIQMPFKFRLGSVEYVDWLEGKPGSNFRY